MKYIETDQRIHLLAQTIAKINRSFVKSQEDDSHTNLYFDSLGKRLLGRWINGYDDDLLFGVNLSTWQFEWMDSQGNVLQQYSIAGKGPSEYEQSIQKGLDDLGLSANGAMDALHFEITDYPFKDDSFEPISAEALDEWMELRTIANTACQQLLGHSQGVSEVRIWPHHFDTGIYFMMNSKGIGFGLAMADGLVDSPYFYIAAYPEKGGIDYTRAPQLASGEWISSTGFSGGVLPISNVESLDQSDINAFITTCYQWLLKQ